VYAKVGKRVLDLVLVIPASVLLCPAILLITILIRINLGSPVFFRQERAGLNGRYFTLYKFRTMADARDADGRLLPDADRLHPFGAKLRKWSLDELPTFINVLLGDMSLVGPRPLLTRYLARYTPEQNRRHEVRPGVTGWAQVNGRNQLSWEEKFTLDVWYVDHLSLILDVKILFLTVYKTLKHEGISQDDHATMEEFLGS
jgi:sugar transferase EpsL